MLSSIGTKVLTGWVWATDDQVVELMGFFEPAMLTADPPALTGPQYFGTAIGFLNLMRPRHLHQRRDQDE